MCEDGNLYGGMDRASLSSSPSQRGLRPPPCQSVLPPLQERPIGTDKTWCIELPCRDEPFISSAYMPQASHILPISERLSEVTGGHARPGEMRNGSLSQPEILGPNIDIARNLLYLPAFTTHRPGILHLGNVYSAILFPHECPSRREIYELQRPQQEAPLGGDMSRGTVTSSSQPLHIAEPPPRRENSPCHREGHRFHSSHMNVNERRE